MTEREITAPVALCGPDGRLNPDAVGWSRTPMHDTAGIGRGRVAWGRNKRWEYWAIMTPTHVFALTVSSLDYAAVHAILAYDRRTGTIVNREATVPLARGASLPASLGEGSTRARARNLSIDIDETPDATRLRATSDGVDLDITVDRVEGHESLSVVVPWSNSLFQYTVKDLGRPAHGRVRLGDEVVELRADAAWAALDHGRGRWPYSLTWNWAAASGRAGEHSVQLQFGGRWTVGTGSTENGVIVDGRLHKLGEELAWDYDTSDFMRPWRIHGSSLDVAFEPFWDRVNDTELLLISTHGHQCFGRFSGWVEVDGRRIAFDGLEGWAEEVRNRW
ncbi:DUF2804 domain-containing protein [Agromyces salentinus]|uniref:DUF2804 domain-containing protein n=1 Tax=Agromyces salentinus TaxID=269421 RepID=A0ABN2MH11_9MICO|nr:DUF2804 domain-containing protein [Agromyces salentinus]